jgi:glycosyltransferase involved in cell wall biosynthesis
MSALEWLSYHSANRIIALSPGMIDGIKKRGIPDERILLVPNGCDLDIFSKNIETWRPSQINDNNFLAVYAGTHGIANGLDSIIHVAAELKRRGRFDIKILLIGQGRFKTKLQQEAQVHDLSNLVFHEPVDKLILAKLLASADLGLQTLANIPAFYYGTSPNKFFDYIAAGLPVLTNYPGWIADLITQNDSGFVIPPDDINAFADVLEYAADHSLQINQKGLNARFLAEKEFNREYLGHLFSHWLEGAVK